MSKSVHSFSWIPWSISIGVVNESLPRKIDIRTRSLPTEFYPARPIQLIDAVRGIKHNLSIHAVSSATVTLHHFFIQTLTEILGFSIPSSQSDSNNFIPRYTSPALTRSWLITGFIHLLTLETANIYNPCMERCTLKLLQHSNGCSALSLPQFWTSNSICLHIFKHSSTLVKWYTKMHTDLDHAIGSFVRVHCLWSTEHV